MGAWLSLSQALFNNTQGVVQLIESVNDRVNDIIEGNTSIQVSYNLDLLRPGPGINLDRSIPNRLKINNVNQEYNIENSSIVDITTNNNIRLGRFTNYVRHENSSLPITLTTDLQLFIDDTDISWSKGQSLDLVINDPIDLGVYNLKIYSDALNRLGTGEFGKNIINLTDIDFDPINTPIFKITCIDAANFEFRVDKIR